MSSREYHKCMSECYFTRGLVWMLMTGLTARLVQSEPGAVLAVLDGIMSVSNFYQSYRERRKAQ